MKGVVIYLGAPRAPHPCGRPTRRQTPCRNLVRDPFAEACHLHTTSVEQFLQRCVASLSVWTPAR